MNWIMWQAEQLKTLEQFKRENEKIFGKKFSLVNKEIEEFLKETYELSGLEQESEILNEIKENNKFKEIYEKGLEGSFFQLNEKKMNALIKATTDDLPKAEHAMLRMVNDQYRKIIFKAEVMANSGAFTLQQSIDMATKDFLKAGINCIEYKGGRRVNIASYAEMCIRTATKRAALISEGDVRNAYGIHTVRISKYGGCSETCLPWQGRIYVDDVYSGGTKEEAKEKKLTLLSEAIAGGLFHPNCKHRATTYFYDFEEEEKLRDEGIENPIEEQEHRKNHLHIQQQKRLEQGSLDQQNIKQAKERKEEWIEKDDELLENHPELESDGLDIPKFIQRKNEILNSEEIVNKYFNMLDIQTNEDRIIDLVKKDMIKIPERDLKLLEKHKVNLRRIDKKSGSFTVTKKAFSFKRNLNININPEKAKTGAFAHEFAHFAAYATDLYKDKEFLSVLKNALKNSSYDVYNVKDNEENLIKTLFVDSPCFVDRYQGRTYITYDNFVNNGCKMEIIDLKEYVSVGYECFVVNPNYLYRKDPMLYNYFKERGLYK